MKKFISALVLCFIFSGSVAHAQTVQPTQSQLLSQLIVLVTQYNQVIGQQISALNTRVTALEQSGGQRISFGSTQQTQVATSTFPTIADIEAAATLRLNLPDSPQQDCVLVRGKDRRKWDPIYNLMCQEAGI